MNNPASRSNTNCLDRNKPNDENEFNNAEKSSEKIQNKSSCGLKRQRTDNDSERQNKTIIKPTPIIKTEKTSFDTTVQSNYQHPNTINDNSSKDLQISRVFSCELESSKNLQDLQPCNRQTDLKQSENTVSCK